MLSITRHSLTRLASPLPRVLPAIHTSYSLLSRRLAHTVIIGAGIGGVPAAYDLKKALGPDHSVTVVEPRPVVQFTPSNPWVAVGWRTREQIVVPFEQTRMKAMGIDVVQAAATNIDPVGQTVDTSDGQRFKYDYLIVATGPKLAFDEVPGLGPKGETVSICTTDHAVDAWEKYQKFVENPGPIIIGAAPGASCFGPAYEFALILDTDLRRRKIRHLVPITYVTSEPYVGHLGLGSVGDSKGMLESEFRSREIKWVTNAKILSANNGSMEISLHDTAGAETARQSLPFSYSMILPAFKGVDAVANVKEICNPRGFVNIDAFQRNPVHPNIFSVGVCVAIPPVEQTPVPTGAPKTGYMIRSMVAAIVENIKADIAGQKPTAQATWNAVCLADMGDTGIAFVAAPQIPPRNVTLTTKGKMVHLLKKAFEKYFMVKVRTGVMDTWAEKSILRMMGVTQLADGSK